MMGGWATERRDTKASGWKEQGAGIQMPQITHWNCMYRIVLEPVQFEFKPVQTWFVNLAQCVNLNQTNCYDG